ncbi:MAG: putative divalent heavy-metal cations transporter [Bacteroidetes bacterium]|jgi:zinc transporter ZupT|nr:putative divalent heavy-metal cations transporter [Bacteroidota bacterium]
MYIFLFCSVIVSGVSVLFINISSKNLKLLLSFSGAFLFAISVLHLIPEIYSSGTANIGVYILVGFFAQILLEFFSEGIEHGHIHIHKHDHAHSAFPYAMMIGLSIHSFLEGMPLANGDTHAHDSLLTGIVLHNIPIAIALMTMLLQSHISKKQAIMWLIVFALITPLGSFTSYAIGANMIGGLSMYFDRIMAVVVGIFLHISTTILFESSENHRFNLIKFVVIILGAALAFLGS